VSIDIKLSSHITLYYHLYYLLYLYIYVLIKKIKCSYAMSRLCSFFSCLKCRSFYRFLFSRYDCTTVWKNINWYAKQLTKVVCIYIYIYRLCFKFTNNLNGLYGNCLTPRILEFFVLPTTLDSRISNCILQKPLWGYAQQLTKVAI